MEIITLEFEKELTLTINGDKLTLVAFKTGEHGNIKIGVNGPKHIKIDREEIHRQKKLKLVQST